MTTLVVLFNLKSDTDHAAYEQWAKTTDIPTAGGLASVDRFEVLKAQGLLMSDSPSPYQYVELIEVNDMQQFGQDVQSDVMQKVAAQFQRFADNPLFILTQAL
ncbi:REDY-like protein HapK [Shewanella glacialipiscicola]|uniref:REDY-like protein HapK n=1 Tax=Shewanella glacialipiscicola TaxID=614069 RepID=UPI0021D8EAEE|nr:REDY-like protein HapK [Shewanella glacialipiscicola]MCU7995475.1 REDY-like protein HapK [Shewanella glacialipiscicola]MCU8026722.1 REDY-like protein HapK [Shewanella glacialipiscicola]